MSEIDAHAARFYATRSEIHTSIRAERKPLSEEHGFSHAIQADPPTQASAAGPMLPVSTPPDQRSIQAFARSANLFRRGMASAMPSKPTHQHRLQPLRDSPPQPSSQQRSQLRVPTSANVRCTRTVAAPECCQVLGPRMSFTPIDIQLAGDFLAIATIEIGPNPGDRVSLLRDIHANR
jgi:hypothetical protein